MSLEDDLKNLIEHGNAEAQALLRALAEAMPQSVDAHTLLAQSHLRRLEFEPALAAYRHILALNPKHAEALQSVALCHMAMNDYPAALAAHRQALALTASASSMRFIGLLSHRMGQIDAAIQAYEKVLGGANPTSFEVPPALQGLVAALRDAGRPLAADRHVQSLIDRFQRERTTLASLLVNRNSIEDFPEWSRYADKAHLGLAAMRRRAVDPSGRVPETFVLPQDRAALAAFAAGPDAPPLYIVKPVRSSGGQGIAVTDTAATALDRDEVVVQRYLDRPYLVNGRKGHVRVYGLITSAEPLRAYVYSEGVVRFAPQPYDPDPARAGDIAMHVTNTALHLNHPDMVVSEDASQEDVGMIWSLSALLRRIGADGGDGQAAFTEIKRLVEWFVRMLVADGLFARQAAAGPRRGYAHKLFGLDVLIDADAHPWLIEMQRIPAATGAPLVNRINAAMFNTMFRMAQGVVTDDGQTPDQLAAIRADPQVVLQREFDFERANRGLFVPLDL